MGEAREKDCHVRMSESELATAEKLKALYGLRSLSELVRYMLAHTDRTQPDWLGNKIKAQRVGPKR